MRAETEGRARPPVHHSSMRGCEICAPELDLPRLLAHGAGRAEAVHAAICIHEHQGEGGIEGRGA